MSKEKPSTIVYSGTNETRQVTPRLLLLSSYQLDWNGIQVEHHRQPAWEIPEHSNAEHVIVVHHCRTQVERVLNGCRRSELVLNGNAAIDEVRQCHALILGSPVHMGMLDWRIKKFIDSSVYQLWLVDELVGKVAGVFATGGGYGNAGSWNSPRLLCLAR
ncbi:flavodoxin family protein [Iningainema tapete]|uniref:Flavodoxin family protein n=1 Tax=Iningainema tapete BLCC-T55 TaxID=2748662 RepID=A0A8J6XJF0_9CYAN|nr:NAD(P)H-dependent oxidoreductase [Iningainema tapete]MBD2771397.1 flavodoxin family protein [Iningainema tapete BLCC-T55]